MRVIAGEFRGRRLDRIEGMDIRPTSDKVKESLFNILGDVVIDSVFLDLFGGTGGIGIEALSRGAKHAVFADADIKSIKVLKGNLEHLNIKDNVEVFNTEYSTAISKLYMNKKEFDIIFIDPPYSVGLAQNALKEIDKYPILAQSGLIIVEHDSRDDMPSSLGKLYMYRSKQYGNTTLSFYAISKQTQQKEE
ncbi:MAG: 16S rRNA (guanine(966)-N(2))-methyltransferase RsmD [Clostridia bacterium]